MVTTNPELRPSKRLERILALKLEPKGYKYLKSKSQFVQKFPLGERRISISYISTAGYISMVIYAININFHELEKCFKKIFPKFGKSRSNYTLFFNNVFYSKKWLCDEITGEYNDVTINNNANEFFNNGLPKIESIWEKYQNYNDLYKEYSEVTKENWKFLPIRIDKLITNGLILTKNINPSEYNQVKEKYLTKLKNWKGQYDKTEIEYALNFIETYEEKIKLNITNNI